MRTRETYEQGKKASQWASRRIELVRCRVEPVDD